MRRELRAAPIAAAMILTAAGAGCSDGSTRTGAPPPSAAPSAPASLVPSAAASAAGQAMSALCRSVAGLRTTFEDLQASQGVDIPQATGWLTTAAEQLRAAAGRLSSSGRSDLASFAESTASVVDALKIAVAQSKGIPAAIRAAVAAAGSALAQLPPGTCPSP